MQKEFITGIEEFNTVTMNSIKRLGEIQLRAIERLSEQQIALTSEYMNEGVKQLQSIAGSKDLGKIVESQVSYVSGFNQRVVDDAQKTVAILTDSQTELTDWVEEGIKSASNNAFAKAVASKAA